MDSVYLGVMTFDILQIEASAFTNNEYALASSTQKESSRANYSKSQTRKSSTTKDLNSDTQQGRDGEKWIPLNIQDPSIFDCQVLNRDIWKNSGIMNTVKENFIFMQYTVRPMYIGSADINMHNNGSANSVQDLNHDSSEDEVTSKTADVDPHASFSTDFEKFERDQRRPGPRRRVFQRRRALSDWRERWRQGRDRVGYAGPGGGGNQGDQAHVWAAM